MKSIRNDFTLKIEKKCLYKVCNKARREAWSNDSNLVFIIDGKEYKNNSTSL